MVRSMATNKSAKDKKKAKASKKDKDPKKAKSTKKTGSSSRLNEAQKKWERKTLASLDKMARNIKSPEAYNKYCSKLATLLGVTPAAVKAGPAAKEWKHFVNNYKAYRPAIVRGIKASASAGSWKKGFRAGILGK